MDKNSRTDSSDTCQLQFTRYMLCLCLANTLEKKKIYTHFSLIIKVKLIVEKELQLFSIFVYYYK